MKKKYALEIQYQAPNHEKIWPLLNRAFNDQVTFLSRQEFIGSLRT